MRGEQDSWMESFPKGKTAGSGHVIVVVELLLALLTLHYRGSMPEQNIIVVSSGAPPHPPLQGEHAWTEYYSSSGAPPHPPLQEEHAWTEYYSSSGAHSLTSHSALQEEFLNVFQLIRAPPPPIPMQTSQNRTFCSSGAPPHLHYRGSMPKQDIIVEVELLPYIKLHLDT